MNNKHFKYICLDDDLYDLLMSNVIDMPLAKWLVDFFVYLHPQHLQKRLFSIPLSLQINNCILKTEMSIWWLNNLYT